MPEEINRVLTDAISRWLFVSERSGVQNLKKEGVADDRVFFVGNVMIDTLLAARPRIEQARVLEELRLDRNAYAVVTLHRPSNVDDPAELARLVAALVRVQQRLPLVFPVHPRTRVRLGESGLDGRLADAGIRLVDPLSYVEFMSLVTGAAAAITDSGGVQEETTYLGIPCLTLRRNTERPITIDEGTNRLVCAETLPDVLRHALRAPAADRRRPQYWDGRTAVRCVADLRRRSNELDAAAIAAE
jgi:UDP-N-acetylglucosamine 2-epimerase (non-hydrolysing)